MQVDLIGMRALVTGSTRGIGYAVARQLATSGAAVTINGRTADSVGQALVQLRSVAPGAKFEGVGADVATEEGCAAIATLHPTFDIVVHNAAFYQWANLDELTDADWIAMFQMNVLAGMRLARQYLPGMLERKWGRIVLVGSEAGFNIPSDMLHYGVCKAAEIALARGLAELTAGRNVTVNSVLPGPTASGESDDFLLKYAEQHQIPIDGAEGHLVKALRPTSLLQRLATVDEVAAMILYACSKEAAATNGAALRVDGGILRHPG